MPAAREGDPLSDEEDPDGSPRKAPAIGARPDCNTTTAEEDAEGAGVGKEDVGAREPEEGDDDFAEGAEEEVELLWCCWEASSLPLVVLQLLLLLLLLCVGVEVAEARGTPGKEG